jgi:UDP-N-acetyl-D-mannosaminuronic acid dehydrogenase
VAVEPHVDRLPRSLDELKNVTLRDAHEAIGKADLVLLLVDHNSFKSVTRQELDGRKVIDTRGMWR